MKDPVTPKIASLNFAQQNVNSFRTIFADENTCMELLATLKWDSGFICKNCGHDNSCKGKSLYSKRCTKCKKEESVTANTLFHKCKIPINKAFEIAYMACNFPDISSYEISRQSEMRHMTCYKFQKKIKNCKDDKEKDELFSKIISAVNNKIMMTV